MPILRELKTPFLTILFFFIVLAIYSKLAGPIPFAINSTTNADTFTVTGEGKAYAVPENATISLGVTKQGTTEQAAKDAVNTAINTIIADLKELGVPETNIQTTNFNIYPITPNDRPAQPLTVQSGTESLQPTGYTATQNLEIKNASKDLANKIIDTATADGANLLGGANFTLDDTTREKLENEARKKAIADAKEKAQQIAQEAGLNLGRLVNIQESSGGGGMFYSRSANLEAKAQDTSTNLQPGENEVVVNVTLFYETR